MDFVRLDQSHHDQLLELEGRMYWDSGKWKDLWDREAKQKFDDLITDYLTNFPQGCFGLADGGELVGAIFLLKVSELKPIPYVNKVTNHLDEHGDIAYVSFFVIKKGNRDEDVAQELYDKAEDVALLSIGCKKNCRCYQ